MRHGSSKWPTPEKAVKLDAIPATVGGAAWSPDGKTRLCFQPPLPKMRLRDTTSCSPCRGRAPAPRPRAAVERVCRPAECVGSLLHARSAELVAQAGIGTRSAVVRLSLDGKTPPSADRSRRARGHRAQHESQADRLGVAGRERRPAGASSVLPRTSATRARRLPIPELAPANLRSVEPELVHWKSGPFTIEGLLYLPPAAGLAKVPLIVDVHGGPFGAWENRNDPFAAFPGRPRLGGAAAQSARLVELRREVRRRQQERSGRRRLSRT